ncbi:class I SAM-dependent methyltransferase [Pseudoalteromonas byunsanensis]|uniref:Methyltransferase type 11 domain-containing protein n=1 Tax=Pseudoalteromonas byunsanensis TaxID=327939 RepID=A0A1S1NE27_9GAMM|nr:class I SAM-dependent methyltransferase [Pseudoalteromonas byunsanensis]OHU96613.1 hypothetical protein BIW53_04595 [Pseudoalteromonas byunsanensis]
MFDSYNDIFTQRAKTYDTAMHCCSDARRAEFECATKNFPWKHREIVADIPSGAGYLSKYRPREVDLYHIDSCDTFNQLSEQKVITSPLEDMPFPDNHFDRVISIAGSHHMEDKNGFFCEVKRVLKPGGVFNYSDVMQGSKEDTFLNQFVDSYNSMGHQGIFISKGTISDLANTGFDIVQADYQRVCWQFNSEQDMVFFVKSLFGLDLADDDTILTNIKDILGYQVQSQGVTMEWALYYIDAQSKV